MLARTACSNTTLFSAYPIGSSDPPLQLPLARPLLTYQVDDVWTPRPRGRRRKRQAGRRPASADEPTAVENPSVHRYEVVYTTKPPLGWLWTRLRRRPAAGPAGRLSALLALAADFGPL